MFSIMSDIEHLKNASASEPEKIVNRDGDPVCCDSESGGMKERPSLSGDSKVVVQILPSVDLGSISALAELNALSGLSVKSKNGSLNSDVQPSSSSGNWSSYGSDVDVEGISDVDLICAYKRISELEQTCIPSRNKQVSKRSLKKRKSFNGFTGTYSIYPGNGMKLLDIKHVTSELAKSSAQVLRILHYLLFGIYGLIASEALLERTRENILQFSGFSFCEDTDEFRKKEKALLNLPYPLLVCVHKVLINSTPVSRSDAVVSLLQFLQKPTDAYVCKEMPGDIQRELNEEEIKKLKSEALEAHPVVLLKRMNGNFAKKMRPKNKQEKSLKHQTFADSYIKPPFIRCGTGVHLKHFPEIVDNIHKARRRIVNLLHFLLYGRPGSDTMNRQNILEFNGFTPSQKNFVARKMAYLKRLRAQELTQLCDVFSLRVKTGNKNKKIVELLQFLSSPHQSRAHRTRRKQNTMKRNNEEDNILGDGKSKKVDRCQNKIGINGTISETACDKQNLKLRDFDTICSKVECASPDTLSELSDLLFVKPCDYSEIHQKILDFTSFSFSANSFDFHCRKTLIHYMDMKTVRKIADLLDIKDWENCRSHQDLSQNILNFLMNMKLPDQKAKSSSGPKSKRMKSRPNIMKLYSDRNFPKSRSCSPENFDSTYASEELNENEGDLQMSVYSKSVSHSSAFHHKNGMFSKQEHALIDSTPLLEFVQHPTDKELYRQIDKIISTAPLSITLGGLITEVLKCYSNFNLHYRIDFIRNKALEILQDLRESIVISPD